MKGKKTKVHYFCCLKCFLTVGIFAAALDLSVLEEKYLMESLQCWGEANPKQETWGAFTGAESLLKDLKMCKNIDLKS